MPKALPQVYEPTTPPLDFEDWHRWIDDELNRIRNSLQANPVIMTVTGTGTIDIDTVPTTIRLGIGDSPVLDAPSGSWDPLLGVYTTSLGGLYEIACQCFIAAFGPGNKSYQATLEVFVNGITRGVQITGGADDVPLALNFSNKVGLLGLDEVYIELTTLHEQFTGSSTYFYNLSILRQATL